MLSKNLLKDKLKWVIFDIDGVLIDVSKSFDQCVLKTVEYLIPNKPKELTIDIIRKMRNIGEFGDDFKITEAIIRMIKYNADFEAELQNGMLNIEHIREKYPGLEFNPQKIVEVFNSLYLGKNTFAKNGLWKKEQRIVNKRLLKKIISLYKTGIITGRNKVELKLAMQIIGIDFKNNIITREYGLKPDPDLLYRIVNKTSSGLYIGDTQNDKKLVENYNKKYKEKFKFLKVSDKNNINSILKNLL